MAAGAVERQSDRGLSTFGANLRSLSGDARASDCDDRVPGSQTCRSPALARPRTVRVLPAGDAPQLQRKV